MKHQSEKPRTSADEAKAVAPPPERGISRWKLALGAASLFFFVVGVKRSFRTDDGREILQSDADLLDEERDELQRTTRKSAVPGTGRAAANRPRTATPGSRSAGKTEADTRSARKPPTNPRPARKTGASSRSSTKAERASESDPRPTRSARPRRGDPDPEKRRRR